MIKGMNDRQLNFRVASTRTQNYHGERIFREDFFLEFLTF